MSRSDNGMTLGDLLGLARRNAGRFAGWIEAGDPELAAHIARDQPDDTDLASLVREAVADFCRDAGDDDWAQLVSASRRAADPALAALGVMVRWRASGANRPETAPAPVLN